jgi:hypothetical protein
MRRFSFAILSTGFLGSQLNVVSSFSTPPVIKKHCLESRFKSCLSAHEEGENHVNIRKSVGNSALMVMAALLLSTTPVHADEYGRETEAPTLYTGETTEVRKVDELNSRTFGNILNCLYCNVCFADLRQAWSAGGLHEVN